MEFCVNKYKVMNIGGDRELGATADSNGDLCSMRSCRQKGVPGTRCRIMQRMVWIL